MRAASLLLALAMSVGCNADPGEIEQTVGYRDGSDGGPDSGERGSVVMTEVLWSGSVHDDGTWDRADVFVEIRNQGNFILDVSGWQIVATGAVNHTWVIPDGGPLLTVGDHRFIAASNAGCFPDADWVVPELDFGSGDPFALTLLDKDDRLLEPIGSETSLPFAGGYDLVTSRSMERAELMFGGDGTRSESWHFYTPAEVDVPNDDRVADDCRRYTHASPGRPNSPDYSGAYATGSLE
jgi:hypothetical protein